VLFNSLEYLFFLPVVVCLYYLIPQRFRWVLLLGASYAFYMAWKVEYALLIFASTSVDYFVGLAMGRCEERRDRRKWLWLSLGINLGLLFTFKYANFASESLHTVAEWLDLSVELPMLDVLLPIGISFYTFQTLSYTIDVYRGHQQPERHFGRFAVFVAFFPQLVAGPIERAGRLLPQFLERHPFELRQIRDGLRMILLGFFKKLVVADQAALYVDPVYADPASHDGLTLLMAAYLFAFQVYCDFSGYSDIAVGSARLMGFRLMENFRRPHLAHSIQDLWRRWHLSLTTWFRDYIYIPLGGNRTTTARWAIALSTVFLTSGLWHGAAWTFIIFGGLHAAYVLIGTATASPRDAVRARLPDWLSVPGFTLRVVLTFHLWCFSLIFFRAATLADAVTFIEGLGAGVAWSEAAFLAGLSWTELIAITVPAVALSGLEFSQGERTWLEFLDRRPVLVSVILQLLMFYSILTLGVMDSQQFVYFQF
jgi:D-alanyl-lipoteichoic acid acyltransferase DltB (MBOAT superfamily)